MRAFVSLALLALALAFVFVGYAALHQRAAAALERNDEMARALIERVENRSHAPSR